MNIQKLAKEISKWVNKYMGKESGQVKVTLAAHE